MKKDLRRELLSMKAGIELVDKEDLQGEERDACLELIKNGQSLPSGVYRYYTVNGEPTDDFFRVHSLEDQLSSDEIYQYILLKQHEHLTSIKGYVRFFFIITVISIISSLLILVINKF